MCCFFFLSVQVAKSWVALLSLSNQLIDPLIHHSTLRFWRMGADMGAMGGTKVLLLVFLVGWEKSLGLNWNPIPRKTVRYQGEWPIQVDGGVQRAQQPPNECLNYEILLGKCSLKSQHTDKQSFSKKPLLLLIRNVKLKARSNVTLKNSYIYTFIIEVWYL